MTALQFPAQQLGLDAAFYEALPHTDGAVNLVMLHGGIGTACGEDMINLNLLKNRGIDYLALGHIHSYQTGPLDETGSYCYPGCLEGRGFDECGEKGFVLLTVEDGSVAHEFVPFSARQLHRVPVDITGLTQKRADCAAHEGAGAWAFAGGYGRVSADRRE